MSADACFHCALPVPIDCDFQVEVGGDLKSVCCPGCKAVAELIFASGLQNYYEVREPPEPGIGRPQGEQDEWQIFDRADMQNSFSEHDSATVISTIYVAGMYCSACSWLIESSLSKSKGISGVEVNPLTHRVRVQYRPEDIGLGRILGALSTLGYKPQPLAPDSAARPELEEQRSALKRLLVASLGMMQVMMFAVALYAGEFQGIDPSMQRFLRLVSFLVTTPVVFYSARPFFYSAIRGLRAYKPGMDLPVSLAIGSAYLASTYATITNGPAVWFDSVVMFVFFLTLGRFLEMRTRYRSLDKTIALSTSLPNTVTRIENNGVTVVPVAQLAAGDRLLVRTGDAIPADGEVTSGTTRVDEALLTGESRPKLKIVGDTVIAGSVSLDGSIEMTVTATGVDSTLGAITRLSERARYTRPEFVQLADRVASYMVVAILVVAAIVAVYWYKNDPERAFVITLSVLVVTCPCALALATPAAFAAAGSRLAELRLLLTNGNAIEVLARANHIVFDKTGTLTFGKPTITSLETFSKEYDANQCRGIAAALEIESLHPIAAAFSSPPIELRAVDIECVVGEGVQGRIDGRHWRLGSADFVSPGKTIDTQEHINTEVWLGNDDGVVALFRLDDEFRADAIDTIRTLRKLGVNLALLSGDGPGPVSRAARILEIDNYHSSCSPQQKLTFINECQQANGVVVMVGDGINDAPVLAGADVSIAPAHAAKLAQTSADIIVLGDALRPIVTVLRMAKRTMRIVRQNLSWAIVYNATALPLAALGYVPPWLAAIGMSASSLIVVLNALRLSRFS